LLLCCYNRSIEELGLLSNVEQLGLLWPLAIVLLPALFSQLHQSTPLSYCCYLVTNSLLCCYNRRIEELGLLSKVEELGLLSKLESSGLTLSQIEKSGLLSKAEKAGILTLVADK
jgi:hypothetical protein